MLKQDLKRTTISFGMLLAILIGLVLLIEPVTSSISLAFRTDALAKDNYLNFIFSSMALGGFLIFTPVITVLPGVITFCDEYNTGYVKYILVRKRVNHYLRNRYMANGLAGGIATALPLVLMTLLSLIVCQPYTADDLNSGRLSPFHQTIFADVEMVWGGLLCVLIIILLAFVFGVVWSTIGLSISILLPNRYVALCAPFVLFYALHIFFNALQLPQFSPVNTIMPDILPSFWFLAIYQAVLLVASTLLYCFAAKRRLTNV